MSGTNGNGSGVSTYGRVDFAARRPTCTVDVPELDMQFRLRSLSFGELRRILDTGDDPFEALALAIIDDDGNRIYEHDIENLREMSVGVFRILNGALRNLLGASQEAQDDIAKKSEASPSTDSASVSQAT